VAASASYEQHPDRGKPEFQALVDAYYAPLYRFAMSLTRSESDAADLVQEVFLLWANKGHQLQDPSKAKAWLFTTLHRSFLQGRRRSIRFPAVEISTVESELPIVEPADLELLDSEKLLDLLSRLDPQYRAAVSLFYLEDYSYEQIGTVLDVPLGTVKSRISRGLAQLKSLMSKRLLPRASAGGKEH